MQKTFHKWKHIELEILQIPNHTARRFTAQLRLRRLFLAGRPKIAVSQFAKRHLQTALTAFFKLFNERRTLNPQQLSSLVFNAIAFG